MASPNPARGRLLQTRAPRSTRASRSCGPSVIAERSARCSGASPDINADLGDAETAAAQFEESLTLFIEFGDRWFCVLVLEAASFLAASSQDLERAVRLLGAADTVLGGIGVPLLQRLHAPHDRVLAESRASLGMIVSGQRGTRAGGSRSERRSGSWRAARARIDPGTPDALTTRELEVLALVADGRTDAEVAERLVVSVRPSMPTSARSIASSICTRGAQRRATRSSTALPRRRCSRS